MKNNNKNNNTHTAKWIRKTTIQKKKKQNGDTSYIVNICFSLSLLQLLY